MGLGVDFNFVQFSILGVAGSFSSWEFRELLWLELNGIHNGLDLPQLSTNYVIQGRL